MDKFTNILDFIISALPCIAGVIIGEVINKEMGETLWQLRHASE
ncbi:hypothetical protein ABVC47_06235 [Fannyhessea vaginae]